MSLKAVLNEVLGQSGFLQKDNFVGSSDPDDIVMVSIANRVADEIRRFYPWDALEQTHSITFTDTGGVPDTLYALPAGFSRMVQDSGWSTNGSRKVDIPNRRPEWYQIKNSALSPGGVVKARLLLNYPNPTPGDYIEIAEPTVGESITINYITDYPIIDTSNNLKDSFTSDTDVFYLNDYLLTLGVQAHWMQTKLMPQYQEHMVNYLKKMNEAIGQSTGAQIISGEPKRHRYDPYYPLWRT